MALYSMASDLQTRGTVWISTNVVKGRPQLNSHRDDNLGRCLQHNGVDGLSSVELADLHTDYQGWVGPGHRHYCNPEARRVSFPA